MNIGDPVRNRRGRRGILVDPGSGAHPLARVAVVWDGSGVVEVVSPRSVWRFDRETAGQAPGMPLLSALPGMSPDTSTDQEVIGMNVKAENEKIAQAVKGQAAARKPRRVSAKEALQTKPPTYIPGTGIVVEDGAVVGVDEAKVLEIEEKDMTVGEVTHEAPDGTGTVTHPAPDGVKTTPKAEKAVTVLEDPIENQNLIRMRAKWAAQRADAVVERLEKAGDAKGVKEAKKVANAAWAQEARELKTLRSMREASKAAKTAVEA